MLENKLIRKYSDTMDSANEIMFLDKIIQREFGLGAEDNLEYIEEYAREMLKSVQKWKKDLKEYKKIAKALRKDLHEIDTILQEDASNADDKENG